MNDPLRFSDPSCSTCLRAAGATASTRAGSRNHIRLLSLAMTLSATVFFAPPVAHAQKCTGNINIGCSSPEAVCSPVDSGVGPTGHCRTPPDQPSEERECNCVGTPAPPPPPPATCSADRKVVEIRGTTDPEIRRSQRDLLKSSLAKDNIIVRLGPDVHLDFSDLPASFFPIFVGTCVTLTSVASFDGPQPGEARTPHSPGPLLRFGPHRDGAEVFFEINMSDGTRISGFRLWGPNFGFQKTDEKGIHIKRSVNIEISNMEIAGWGGDGIAVDDDFGPGHRITNPEQILIHDNFIHHNQHPSEEGHAEGYGVVTGPGAWAKIYRNVFDFNRHAIAANGHTGGYTAEHNLVLKGGGYHGATFKTYTHSFDAHGTGCWWSSDLCGDAGILFSINSNAWQYRKDNDIHIRGKPAKRARIHKNIFPFSSQDDAINLYTTDNVIVGPDNHYGVDTFGQYGVCDFDGDGVDDLFLATGATWWFSSSGNFQWSYLNDKTERLEQLRLGYFDDDLRCDVLADHNGQWMISSGGTSDWKPLGTFGKPLSEVHFGRFDPSVRDHRPGATLQTTHAFFRRADGQWFVTPLSHPDWKPVESEARISMNQLRFGDFNGDGVTDVLAVVNGHWAISESATGKWRTLNANLGDPVEKLYIANMDPDDNIDDILRLDGEYSIGRDVVHVKVTWWRSKNGTAFSPPRSLPPFLPGSLAKWCRARIASTFTPPASINPMPSRLVRKARAKPTSRT
jgi:hypothetical protein